MSRFKRAPYRNRRILDAAKGETCVRCGANDETVVAAHYSGMGAHRLGKGMGQKADDHCVAWLCIACHQEMDSYSEGNGDARAAEFLMLILETQRRLLDRGILK